MTASISLNELREIQYQQQINFSLTISNPQVLNFTCTHITRCLPRKRISCEGLLGDKKVFAKYFIAPKRAKKHWQKELNGIELLSQNSILTAPILYSGNAFNNKLFFIFFECIAEGSPLQVLWNRSNPNKQSKIIVALLTTVAEHHNKGILQKDLHLNNFMLANDIIYTLDGSDIISFDHTREAKIIHNLAQLFAQLPPSEDQHIEYYFKHYIHYRQMQIGDHHLTRLIAQTFKERKKRKQDYMAKTRRNCALFCNKQTWSELSIYSRKYHCDDLLRLLASPDKFIEKGQFLKQGNSSTVAIITLGNKKWVIKRYNIKNWGHFLSRVLRTSRALTSWYNANLLTFYGISTPTPVAIIEKRLGPISTTTYFITEYSTGKTYWDTLYHNTLSNQEKKSIAASVCALLQSLKPLKISHGDLKISNIMIENNVASLIDLDAMRQHSNQRTFEKAQKKDINRFFKNWENDTVNGAFFNKKIGFSIKNN